VGCSALVRSQTDPWGQEGTKRPLADSGGLGSEASLLRESTR